MYWIPIFLDLINANTYKDQIAENEISTSRRPFCRLCIFVNDAFIEKVN